MNNDLRQFQRAYEQIRSMAVAREFSVARFTVLVMAVIRIVESVGKISGPEKKALAIALVKQVVHDAAPTLSDDERLAAEMAIDTVLPGLIDGLIDADHGRLLVHGVGRLVVWIKRLFSRCCGQEEE